MFIANTFKTRAELCWLLLVAGSDTEFGYVSLHFSIASRNGDNRLGPVYMKKDNPRSRVTHIYCFFRFRFHVSRADNPCKLSAASHVNTGYFCHRLEPPSLVTIFSMCVNKSIKRRSKTGSSYNTSDHKGMYSLT